MLDPGLVLEAEDTAVATADELLQIVNPGMGLYGTIVGGIGMVLTFLTYTGPETGTRDFEWQE